MQTVTIPKKEYDKLKKIAEEQEAASFVKEVTEDLKNGRVSRVR